MSFNCDPLWPFKSNPDIKEEVHPWCYFGAHLDLVCSYCVSSLTPPGLYIIGPGWCRWWLLLLPWQQRSSVSGRAEGEWDAPSSCLSILTQTVWTKAPPWTRTAARSINNRLDERTRVFVFKWWLHRRPFAWCFSLFHHLVGCLLSGLACMWMSSRATCPSEGKTS